MTFENSADWLSTLGYTQQWLDYGVLTPALLAKQYTQFETSEDQHPEHYRYGAFRHYLDGRTQLTDEQLAAYLHLALTDRDCLMGGAAAKDLFTEVALTDRQFAEVCARIEEFPGDWSSGLIGRQLLLRRLATTGLDAHLFAECLATGDSVVQKVLLQLANTDQLTELAIRGKTLSIRNAAKQASRQR